VLKPFSRSRGLGLRAHALISRMLSPTITGENDPVANGQIRWNERSRGQTGNANQMQRHTRKHVQHVQTHTHAHTHTHTHTHTHAHAPNVSQAHRRTLACTRTHTHIYKEETLAEES
jgi:hypothetical protein